MTPDQARELDRHLLVAEAKAGQAAAGWAYLTVDGCVIESEADLERCQQLLEAFDKAAAGRESGYYSSSSCLALPSASAGRPRAPMMLSGGWRYCTPA